MLEKEAAEKLGYSAEQVKRRTLTELTKELTLLGAGVPAGTTESPLRSALKKGGSSADGKGSKSRPAPLSVSFDEDDYDTGSSETRNTRRETRGPSLEKEENSRPSREGREARGETRERPRERTIVEQVDDGDDDDPLELYNLYLAKSKFRRQLARDPDFSDADLADWDKSTEQSRRRVEDLIGCDLEHLSLGDAGWARWNRRQDKFQEMMEMGLLDRDLAKKWAEKQAVLAKLLRALERE
jgi:hypothetical protein